MSQKFALLIGNSEYEDTNLTRLLKPSADVAALASILKDTELGGFDAVTPLIDQSIDIVRRAISRFFLGRNKDDLLLLYFAGHGVRDDQGNLYLAVKDSEHDLLRGTAIPAAFITAEMDNSRSQRQVLILDCCHSGAFARGTRGAPGASVGTAAAFEGSGYGRVVLTATDSTQYAWEGDQVIGEAKNSVFTHYLVQGIQTGEADADADGQITVDELYDYVYSKVVKETPKQTPGKWGYKEQGKIVIARNPDPVVEPVELPKQLQLAMESPFTATREEAVRELQRLLDSGDRGLALTAYEALKHMTEDDSRRVVTAAAEILTAYAESQVIEDEKAVAVPEQHEEVKYPSDQVAEPKPPQEDVQEQAETAAEKATVEEVEAETIDIKQVRKEVEQPVVSATPATAPATGERRVWFYILRYFAYSTLIAISCSISWTVGWYDDWYVRYDPNDLYVVLAVLTVLMKILMPGIIGVVIGLVLRRIEPSLRRKQILMLAIGWTIGGSFFYLVNFWKSGFWNWRDSASADYHVPFYGVMKALMPGMIGVVIGLVLTVVIGLVVIGLVLRRIEPSLRRTQILMLAIGWALWCSIFYLVVSVLGGTRRLGLYFVGGGFAGGVITGLVLRWAKLLTGWKQVVVVTIGWAIGVAVCSLTFSIMIPHALPRIQEYGYSYVVSKLFTDYDPEYFALRAVGGAVAGIIGSGIMFWQISRARRRALNSPSSSQANE